MRSNEFIYQNWVLNFSLYFFKLIWIQNAVRITNWFKPDQIQYENVALFQLLNNNFCFYGRINFNKFRVYSLTADGFFVDVIISCWNDYFYCSRVKKNNNFETSH